jgi:light-regulated signal transduction histidine kinase (bacteriophytochrome)
MPASETGVEPALDLTACDREPIHVPGAIQPHGLLLIADPATLDVVAGAGDLEARLAPDWLGRSLPDLLEQDVSALLSRTVAGPGGTTLADPVGAYDVCFHRTGQWLVAELEPREEQPRGAAETLGWLDAIASGFERTTTLKALCERAAVAFRALTGFDRVMIYRFLDDEAGCVVAEDRDPALDTFLHHHFPASDIPRQARALYVRNRTRVIPQVDYAPAPIRPAAFAQLDLSDVAVRSVSPIHVQYLRNMGVGASASISIVKDGVLWGLVACHHNTARTMPRDVRAVAAALAGGLARQIRAKEEADAYRERITLRSEEDMLRPLLGGDEPIAHLVRARGADLCRMLAADGLALVPDAVGPGVVMHGTCPDRDAVQALARWVAQREEAVFSTRAIGSEWAEAAQLAPFAGVLAVRLPEDRATLIWLRVEHVEEVEWAGNPHKNAAQAGESLTPRTSFDGWKETVRGRARRWTLEQVEAAHRLRRLFGEARAAAELRRLNRELERAVADKDAALAQKDILMREVDHRVQNSLQLVASFLAIQARDAGPGAVADQLIEARSRLSAVALVHRRLYRDDQIESIDLGRYLTELMDDMKASLGPEWARRMTLDLAPVLVPTDRAVNVGLVAAELVINATKYAYPAGGGGAIDVVLEQYRNKLRLVVADHGVGRPPASGEGFGSRMMRAVVQRIDGTVEYLDNAPGLRAVLMAPVEGA